MKINEVITLLLAIAVIILILRPMNPVMVQSTTTTSTASGKDTLAIIHSRKSVRNYIDKPVTKKQLDTLVRAAMAAPTAANKQPWAFVVITNRETLNKLAEGLQYGKMLKTAGAAIVVCGVVKKALPGIESEFWIQDCSAASQNILLAAESIGLGAVWTGAYPIKERAEFIRQQLNIPKEIIPLNVISIGHPKGLEKPKNKYDEKNVHHEKW